MAIPGIRVKELLPITRPFNKQSINDIDVMQGLLADCEMLWLAKDILGNSVTFETTARKKSENSLLKKRLRNKGKEIHDQFASSLVAVKVNNLEELKQLDSDKIKKLVLEREENTKLLGSALYFFRRQLALDHGRFSSVKESDKLKELKIKSFKQAFNDTLKFIPTSETFTKEEINERFIKLIKKQIEELEIVINYLTEQDSTHRKEEFKTSLENFKKLLILLESEKNTTYSNEENYFKYILLMLESILNSNYALQINIKKGQRPNQDDFPSLSEKNKLIVQKHLYPKMLVSDYTDIYKSYSEILTTYLKNKLNLDGQSLNDDITLKEAAQFEETFTTCAFYIDDMLKQEVLKFLGKKFKKEGKILSSLDIDKPDEYVKRNGYVANHYELTLPNNHHQEIKFMTSERKLISEIGNAAHSGYVPDPRYKDEKKLKMDHLPYVPEMKLKKPTNKFDCKRYYKVFGGYYVNKFLQARKELQKHHKQFKHAQLNDYEKVKGLKKRSPHYYSIWHDKFMKEIPQFYDIKINNNNTITITQLSEYACAVRFYSQTKAREEGQKIRDSLQIIKKYNLLSNDNIQYTLTRAEFEKLVAEGNQKNLENSPTRTS